MVPVGQLMKQDLATVDTGTSVVESAKLIKACNAGSVLVSHRVRIVGIVTESDIVRKFLGSERIAYFTPVESIVSSPVLGIEARQPITEAAEVMNKHRTRHLGLTKAGAIVGVVSVRDFLQPVAIDVF
ncbi:MAG: CBS domain-containing protein [Nitrospira sp.]|nr:CBS domain-containing protein [Nitrospira sp.]